MAAWYDPISGTVCAELSALCDFVLRAGDLVSRGGIGIIGGTAVSHKRRDQLPSGEGVYSYVSAGVTVFCEPTAVTLHENSAEIQILRTVPYSPAAVRGAELEAGSTYGLCAAAAVMAREELDEADVRLI